MVLRAGHDNSHPREVIGKLVVVTMSIMSNAAGTFPASRETSERSSTANNRRKPLLIDDEALSPAHNLAPHASMHSPDSATTHATRPSPSLAARASIVSPDLATPTSHAIDFDNNENSPTAAFAPNGSSTQPRSRSWLSNHNNPIYGQVRHPPALCTLV